MGQDDRRRIEPQSFLDHFTRIHRCTVDGAVKHLSVLDQPMARIQKQHRKDFMLEACQLVAQVLLDQCGEVNSAPRCIFSSMAWRAASRI